MECAKRDILPIAVNLSREGDVVVVVMKPVEDVLGEVARIDGMLALTHVWHATVTRARASRGRAAPYGAARLEPLAWENTIQTGKEG